MTPKIGTAVRPASQKFALCKTKICDFSNPIYDLTTNSMPFSRPKLPNRYIISD